MLAAAWGPWASPSLVIACMTSCGCLAVKFDSCNDLLSSVLTLRVNILRCGRLYIKRKYYYERRIYIFFRLELIPPRGGKSHTDPSFPLVSVSCIFLHAGHQPYW